MSQKISSFKNGIYINYLTLFADFVLENSLKKCWENYQNYPYPSMKISNRHNKIKNKK